MKRFFDERLIAVAVAAAFALGTFNPQFALLRDVDAQPAWLTTWVAPDTASQPPRLAELRSKRTRAAQALAVQETPAR